MKRSEKQLPSKANFMTFFTRNCSKFRLNSVKGLRDTKNVKEIKFEGVWGELKSKKCYQIQKITRYLRLTLVFMRNSAQ